MISDLNGSLWSRQFLNVANKRTCFASCACALYNTLVTDFPLQNTDVTLRSYSGEKVPILGKISVPVKYSSNDEKVLDLVVVQGNRPALFGRDWLIKIRLDWESIFKLTEYVGNKYSVPKSEIFPPELNTLLEKNNNNNNNIYNAQIP